MSNKSKGSNAERELYQIFIDNSFRAVRVAGSGVMENADCDLIAGKIGHKYGIEVKSTKKTSKYITKEQIESFMIFCEIFELKPVIAIRFNRIGWFFLNPNDLEDSGKNLVVSQDIARTKGKRFSQFFEECLNRNDTKNDKTEKSDDLSADMELLKEIDDEMK